MAKPRAQRASCVLVVDDNRTLAELLGACLGAEGFTTTVAHQLGDARALLRRRRFSTVLSDLDLGVVDESGHEVLLAALLYQPTALRILMTGRARNRVPAETRTLADACLEKPISMQEVLRVLRSPPGPCRPVAVPVGY